MKIYLAGPMRGLPEYNFPAFFAAEWDLGDIETVFNPARADMQEGFDWPGLTGNENLTALGFDIRHATARDHNWISLNADAIACLPGWEDSAGAQLEIRLALLLGLMVFEYEPTHDRTHGDVDTFFDYLDYLRAESEEFRS